MFVRNNVLSNDVPAVESLASEMAKAIAAVNRARVVCPEVDSDKFRVSARKNGQLVTTATAASVEGIFPAIRKAVPRLYNDAAVGATVSASYRLARDNNRSSFGKGGFTITATYESKEAHRAREMPISVTVSSFGFEERQSLLVSEFVVSLQDIVDRALEGLSLDEARDAIAMLYEFADELADSYSAETTTEAAPKTPTEAAPKAPLTSKTH